MSGVVADNVGRSSGLVKAAGGGAWTLIGTSEASNSATLTVTGLDSTYDTYAIAIADAVPATDAATPFLRLGDSGGFDSGSSDYSWTSDRVNHSGPASNLAKDESDSEIQFTDDGIGSAAGEGFGAVAFLHGPGDGTVRSMITGQANMFNNSTAPNLLSFSGVRNAVITHTQIQFLFSSGNVSTGRLTVWGISHA